MSCAKNSTHQSLAASCVEMFALLAFAGLWFAASHAAAQRLPQPDVQTHVYNLNHIDALDARDKLTTALGNSARFIQVLPDEKTKRLIIGAPAHLHTQIGPLLAQLDKVPGIAPGPAADGKQIIQLRTLTARALHDRLQKVLNRLLPAEQDTTCE